MSYQFLEHESDIGVRGIGSSIIEAFQETAKAMFDVMVEVKKIKPQKQVKIEATASDIEGLLVEWLNELIFQKDITGLYFSKFEILDFKKTNSKYHLNAKVWGSKIDPNKHPVKTEVKAATYSALKCGKEKGEFFCQCILDV